MTIQERCDTINRLYASLPEKGTYKRNQPTLKKICDLLFQTAYQCNRVEMVQTLDIEGLSIARRQVFTQGDPPIIVSNEVEKRVVQKYAPASNKNRLKKAWIEGGKKAVGEYILWVNDNNDSINQVNKNAIVTNIVKNKIITIF